MSNKETIGNITFDVICACPHCGNNCHLYQWPYNDESSSFYNEIQETSLGKALFGSVDEPAKWNCRDMNVVFKCCSCKKDFKIKELCI